jgi:transcriptional regulator with XRE-family HTH domain
MLKTRATERRRVICELVRIAHESSGRRTKDLAEFLGISSAAMNAIESGEKEPTLPQLEAIAFFLRTPVHTLLGIAAPPRHTAPPANLNEILRLRGYIIGARLKQARLKQCESLAQCANAISVTPATVQMWEIGRRQPGIIELETLLTHFSLSWDDMLDLGIGPLGELQILQIQQTRFEALPADVRAFVCDPGSQAVLQLAMRLRSLSAEELRTIADTFGLLAGNAPSVNQDAIQITSGTAPPNKPDKQSALIRTQLP